MNKPQRLQKLLASHGIASRRTIEQWIAAGRITLNGKIAVLGDKVEANIVKTRIKIDGKDVFLKKVLTKKPRMIIYNKPVGEVCTRSDEKDRPTIFKNLPRLNGQRWISIGRLDINTSGLLLLTTDGDLANQYMHPSFDKEREYAVRVLGTLDNNILAELKNKFKKIWSVGGSGVNQWYHVILTEGKNRIVRKTFEEYGLAVSRLIRVRFGSILLSRDIRRGQYKELRL